MPDSDLATIINEFRALRVYVGSTEMKWLSEFYGKGGAVPCIKALALLTGKVESYFESGNCTLERTSSYATVIHECLSVLRVLLNTPVII